MKNINNDFKNKFYLKTYQEQFWVPKCKRITKKITEKIIYIIIISYSYINYCFQNYSSKIATDDI